MSTTRDPLAPYMLVPRVLWFALNVSNALIFGIMSATRQPRDEPFDVTLFVALGLASVASGVAHVLLPRRLRAQHIAATRLDTTEEADLQGSVIFREAAPMVRVFASTQKAIAAAASSYQTAFIFGMAMAESIGIYGGVLAFLGCPLEQAVAFPLVGALLMARLFPTRQKMLGPLEAHYGAKVRDA